MQKVAVVVLTYRADPGLFDACLASVLASGDADHVVVVDNGQTLARSRVDAIVAAAGPGVPPVDLLTTEENLGFAGGMNAGLSQALDKGATAVAILNDDTLVEPGWLAALVGPLATARVGAVQPKILLGRPGIEAVTGAVINSVGMSVRSDGAGIDVGYGEPDVGQYDDLRAIPMFTGGAVLFGADFLAEVGGFDERYFLYYEDIDLARRGIAAGWTYVLEPTSIVHHAMSSTAKTLPDLYRYWQERNRLWWLFRHGTPWEIGRGLALSLGRLAKHRRAPQASAIVHGLGGVRWCRRERRAGRVLVTPLPRTGPAPWTVW